MDKSLHEIDNVLKHMTSIDPGKVLSSYLLHYYYFAILIMMMIEKLMYVSFFLSYELIEVSVVDEVVNLWKGLLSCDFEYWKEVKLSKIRSDFISKND